MKYMQIKSQKFQTRFKLVNMLSHEFLWSPTPLYYAFTFVVYTAVKNRYQLSMMQFLPFLAIPATCDYFKRDYYVNCFPKERKEMKQATTVVD